MQSELLMCAPAWRRPVAGSGAGSCDECVPIRAPDVLEARSQRRGQGENLVAGVHVGMSPAWWWAQL